MYILLSVCNAITNNAVNVYSLNNSYFDLGLYGTFARLMILYETIETIVRYKRILWRDK